MDNCQMYITHIFTSFQNIDKLKKVYSKVEDIDLFIGMVLEQPSSSSKALVGDTFLCLIGDQFARLKLGDRFFYDLGDQSGSFTQGKLFCSFICLVVFDF